jgi:hypothetical protein
MLHILPLYFLEGHQLWKPQNSFLVIQKKSDVHSEQAIAEQMEATT